VGLWSVPLFLLFVLWQWQAFSYGGFMSHQWLPASVAVGLFGLVVSLAIAYPRRPRQLSLAVLALFGLYAVWVACSALWAGSTSRVWLEAARTSTYVLVFALALVFLTDPRARRSFRYMLMAATLFLLTASIWELWTTNNVANLFAENRFFFPVTYPNNAAALFLVGFWPLMWLAAGPEERAPIRGIALGVATGLLGLAVMTQSRGAIWSLGLTIILAFVISPARLRTLLYLAVPVVLLVYEFPSLNRYWSEGPASVGGGVGARTILVASIVAALIGVIIALLEKWIRVNGRAKSVVGSLVIVAVVAGIVYGSVALTGPAGGPVDWVSQSWKQFTGQTATEEPSGTRLTMASSSGRVSIWEVALREFQSAPLLGVGADNFIYQHDLLRKTDAYQPQHAHSIELQVLGETGIVGGVLAFAGVLLALGGILWPRCVAGWRGARSSWLRPRGPSRTGKPSGTPSRFCSGRWGDRSVEYGWEMGLLLGVSYWLIHASVDWLWQMMGVALPMLLLLAAGLAAVDARVEVVWPRWNRWLRIRGDVSGLQEFHSASNQVEQRLSKEVGVPAEDMLDPGTYQSDVFSVVRRTQRRSRRLNRAARRKQRSVFLRPAGVLSHSFRALMVVLSLGVIIAAGLPYLSALYQDSAFALARTDAERAAKRAEVARWFQPTDPGPYETQATIYHNGALDALEAGRSDRAGAVLDSLALSIHSLEKATEVEPVNWVLHYRAGVASINLVLASAYASGEALDFDYAEMSPRVHGLSDWTSLSGSAISLPVPGSAAGSLATGRTTQALAARYRDMSSADLIALAGRFLAAADERNPLADDVDAATELLRTLRETLAAD
jgi:hypothetical protein